MGLESATYVTDLNSSNPTGTDLKSQGDDHIRLIKSALQATFPNASRAFRFSNSVAVQTSNYSPAANICDNLVVPVSAASGAITVTLPATPGIDGMRVVVVKTDASSNAVTVAGNGNLINATSTHVLNGQWSSVMLIWCASASLWVGIAGSSQGPLVGEFKAYSGTSAPGGWLRCNGQTIGSAASSATRANADTEALYRHLWDNYSDSICPVSSGRGASAAADFAANKTIALPDLRGRSLFGLDDMGASAAGRLAGATIDQTTNGASGGADTVTLVEANLPSHTHEAGTLAAASSGAHTHFVFNTDTGDSNGLVTASNYAQGADTSGTAVINYVIQGSNTAPTLGLTTSSGAHTHNVTGTTGATGSGTAVDKLPPAFLVTWLIKM